MWQYHSLALPEPTHFKYFHSYLIHKQEAQGPHIVNLSTMFFRSARKNTNLEDGVDISYFLSSFVEFRSEEKSKMSQSIRGRGSHLVFLIGPKKKNKLCTGHWYLASCQVSSNNTNLVEDVEILLPVKFRWVLFSGHRGEVENVSANQRLGGHLVPPIDPKNTTLLEDVEILHPVKFCWIPFSGFRGKIKNASANYKPERLLCSSDRPEKHKRDRRRRDLGSCEFCWIQFIGFRGEAENVSHSEAGWPTCFSNRPD